jgi:mycoredoxin
MAGNLIVYGHEFCPDVFRLQRVLEQEGIAYEWRNIADGDPHWRDEVRMLAKGYLSVPTVVFPDGQVLVEPTPGEVLARLKQLA